MFKNICDSPECQIINYPLVNFFKDKNYFVIKEMYKVCWTKVG